MPAGRLAPSQRRAIVSIMRTLTGRRYRHKLIDDTQVDIQQDADTVSVTVTIDFASGEMIGGSMIDLAEGLVDESGVMTIAFIRAIAGMVRELPDV